MKHKVSIVFPNLLLIPVFSVVGILLKLAGLVSYSWMSVVIAWPIAYYFIWCIGYCILAMLALALIKLYDKLNK